MKIDEIVKYLRGTIVCGDGSGLVIKTACGSDMMSDVLAFVKDQSMLLTGLVNPQVVRTADMMDIRCIVFVRGKNPTQEIINLAESLGIVIITTNYRMFTACGRLYSNGLGGGCDEE